MPQITKILRRWSEKLIKSVKHVKATKSECTYTTSNRVERSRGAWYTEQEYDAEFISSSRAVRQVHCSKDRVTLEEVAFRWR